MARESGYIQPDMTLSRAEIAAERKAWDDAIAAAVAAEREACVKVLEDEAQRLEQMCASVTIGGRAGKWQGGVDALRAAAETIRKRVR